ncbi:LicD family protein [Cohnella zeiphila]|uniref:LicD family protein n=1 Tax=Cohnella zeiphila TaxID=2761120 RepID=A0A7X0SLS9_9BACL|nr:LicD family protein [Cohnella zeiphila]MBB6732244.1 LicD family protein [Cohnella zeiphila]
MALLRSRNVLPSIIRDVSERMDEIYNMGRTVVWFGYLALVDVVQTALADRGQRIDYVVDNDRMKWGRVTYGGVMVSPPAHVLTTVRENAVVLIFSNYADAMVQQVKGYGYTDDQIVRFPAPSTYAEEAEALLGEEVVASPRMTLRELQLVELDILKALREFCADHQLKYYLAGGTLFGAVNYKGFVPWDDDIDIYMPYEDYMKLIKHFPVGGRYEILHWESYDEFFWPYIQMVDNSTIILYGSTPISLAQGVFIDIIPLTGYPENQDEIDYRINMNRYLESQWRWFYNARGVVETGAGRQADCRADVMKRRYDLTFYDSPNVATAVELWGGEEQWIVPRDVFDYGTTLEFEGEHFSVAKGYEEYLKLRARKYANAPVSTVQVAHPINAYWKK